MHNRGAGGDVSSGADLEAEAIFLRHLSPFGTIDSEESGRIGRGENKIYLDPLDGSDNFLSGLPYYGSSVALEKGGRVVAGVVANLADGTYTLKTKNRFVRGVLGKSEEREVRLSDHARVGIFERGYRSRIYADRLKKAKIKYRILGAVALSLSYAHSVRFVLFEGKMRSFDIKAGLYMCEDLYCHISEDLTIICHNREDFTYLKEIVLEDEQ